MPSAVRAQGRDTVARRDTLVRRDSAARKDTLLRVDTAARTGAAAPADTTRPTVPLPADTVKRDTIQPPITHGELPQTADPTGSYHLDREQIFATGAQSVGDLLARLPGVTELHMGWLSAPATATYLGDAARVRVFLDGLEYDALDPHAGGIVDLARLPLWPIQDITVERSPSEVRVYLDSRTVDRTTPYTRTDITTGDLQTNLYRGFFGRRFGHGELLQFGVEQYGALPTRDGGTSDQLSLMGRVGWAHGPFSVDAFALQVRSHRGQLLDPFTGDSLAQQDATRRDAYVRVGLGAPGGAAWVQALASTSRYSFAGGPSGTAAVPADSTDTTAAKGDTVTSGSQYVLAGGLSRWGVRVSGTARYFGAFDRGISPADSTAFAAVLDTASDSTRLRLKPPRHRMGLFVPTVRADWAWWRLALSAYAEGRGTDSVSHREVSAVFTPFSFLRVMGAVGTARDARMADSVLTPNYRRLEAGVRIHDLWIGGGTILRGAAALAAPRLVDDSLVPAREPSATAAFVTVQGRLWKGIHADAFALRWNDSTGFYRPRYQTHAQLYISTSLLDRFPDNSFHFFLGLTHEYRSATFFPVGATVQRLSGYRTVGAQLEIRIERAVLSYRFQNALGEKYNEVPGFLMPRQTSIYGVRWYFWN
ncbi:MAG: Plug domain-containing protein [Gemmatimonadota bacterium]|nr:Plug domain-containing protein [Gemmatimonadota bacterium]